MKKYQLLSGRIVTEEELRGLWNNCNPHFAHDDIEFEISLYCDIKKGALKEVEE